MFKKLNIILVAVMVLSLVFAGVKPSENASAASPVNFTILHTNDFHGNLQLSGSNPGAARVAQKIADVRTTVGGDKVLVLDAGDIMQGSLVSNLQQGLPTIDYYRSIGYNAATFGNHEFDWGQTVLGDRIAQAEGTATADETPVQMVVANITNKDVDGNCTWEPFNANVAPYEIFTVGTAPDIARVGVIGVGSIETPYITIAEATEGLCFRSPLEAITHYYDEVNAAADVLIVLSHNGYADGGYGYGFTVTGDQTLAANLNTAGKPVHMIIGGHSHTDLAAATMVGSTAVVQAHYAGRKVGRADITYDPDTDSVTLAWSRITVATSDPEYAPIKTVVDGYVNDPDYQALINTPVGYSKVDLKRFYDGDGMMGAFVDDAILNSLNNDATPDNDVDMFFNNAGGIRIDWCDKEDPLNPGSYIWSSDVLDCANSGEWAHDPMLLTYGMMFQILPFGNATVVGTMTGAQIQDLLNQSATLFKGAIQPAGIRYKFFRYSDALPGPQPYGWGAYDAEVWNPATNAWEALVMDRTYKVGTNEFLAPAGQDGFAPFKYMQNITYWGDMLNAVNAWVSSTYTASNPYLGPLGDGSLDGRITRNGNGDNVYEAGEVVPLTVLHHNDSHGRLLRAGSTAGYSQLVTLINQERAHNNTRTLLLTSGDNIQGDSMMYYFKSAGLGYATDGTVLTSEMSINPLIKAFNSVGYDAWVLGNHEFNFGKEIFGTLAQAEFPLLQANIADTGEYGLSAVGVEPYVIKTVGVEGIDVAILGIGNHRVPSYELPSNIQGLTFTDPIQAGLDYAPGLKATNDVVVALTHIGFTTNPASVEVDNNVDTYFATQVPGVDAIIGGHSHTTPVTAFGDYKYLPAIVAGPDNKPVLINQANRYNTYLGEVAMGLLPDATGGYDVVSTAGRYIAVSTSGTVTPEDANIVSLVTPYQNLINTYNNTVIGSTTTPIDTNLAFTEETNGANLQADASVWKLESEGIPVDFHLSGAMTNRLIASTATPATPYELKVSDMFAAMPYENSLVVMEMNGPQLKAVLERAYRNYYYYKYVSGYGGYSYYTTCMLDTDKGNKIVYKDTYPDLPDGTNVLGLYMGDQQIDFDDDETYYRVSSVNYLAAGACNFSDSGQTLWPLNQIVADTQYYVRDAVIEYTDAQTGPISPAIEGRLQFPPLVNAPLLTADPSVEGAPVTASATFTDPAPDSSPYTCTVNYGDGSGDLAGVIDGLTCTGPAHSYARYGSYTVTVTVFDENGWLTSNSSVHTVIFQFTGFQKPVMNLPVLNRWVVNAAVPMIFKLGGYKGMNILQPVKPMVAQANCSTGEAIGPQVPLPFAFSLAYKPATDTYSLVFKAGPSWKGQCMLVTLKLVDGTSHTALFEFAR